MVDNETLFGERGRERLEDILIVDADVHLNESPQRF